MSMKRESKVLYNGVESLTRWLDESNPVGEHEDSMRVLKLIEEAGEAASAYIGMVGQNPRKGVTHTKMDLLNELADVVITGLCAMQHFIKDMDVTQLVIEQKLQHALERAGIEQ